MASTYSSNIGIELITEGEQAGAWGTTTNNNWSKAEEATSSYATVTVTGIAFDWTLSDTVDAYTASTTATTGSTGRALFAEFISQSVSVPVSTPTINIRGNGTGDFPDRVFFAKNNLSSSLDLILQCGSGDALTLKNGCVAAVYTAPSGTAGAAANVFSNLQVGGAVLGTGSADATITTNGAHDLILSTNSTLAGSSTITIQDTTSGDILLSPSTSGKVKVDDISIDANIINADSGNLNLSTTSGDVVLDGVVNVAAGVITGATSITSTSFVGDLTGAASNVTTSVGTDTTSSVCFFDGTTGDQAARTHAGLKFDAGATPTLAVTGLISSTVSVSSNVLSATTSVTSPAYTSTGAIAVTSASNGDITLAPNGTGAVVTTGKFNMNGANTFSETDCSGSNGESILIGPSAGAVMTGLNVGANVAIGDGAASKCTTGWATVAIGVNACKETTASPGNLGIGGSSCGASSVSGATGSLNVAVGHGALAEIGAGADRNTGCGYLAGTNLTTGSKNTLLGSHTTTSAVGVDQEVVIGYNVTGLGTNTVTIGNASGKISADTSASGTITWSGTSDVNIKKDISSSIVGLDFIKALRPVDFKFKQRADLDGSESDAVRKIVAPTITDEEGVTTDIGGLSAGVMTGFIAQEVKSAIDSHGLHGKDSGWSLGVDGLERVGATAFVTPLVKAVQELSAQVAGLEARLAAIE